MVYILRNEFGTQLWQFVDAGYGDGDRQNMHNFMNMSSSKSGDVDPSYSNTHVQTQRSVDIDMYDMNDWKKYKIGPWSLKLQHQRQQRGQGGDGDGNEGKVSEEMEQHVRNCLHLGIEFQLKLRHLRVDKC
mmetsp:Transcript_7876/g.11707  ORF Transcript_7876/g.11707 Transcript_7876/m.11707 type:complete len:131 (+) Transcript_7876:57-449(+)